MRINRRHLLATAALAAMTPAVRGFANPPTTPLNALFDQFMTEQMRRSPELVTTLGLDKDAMAAAKTRLDDRSLASRTSDKADTLGKLRRLRGVDRKGLTGLDAISYDTVAYGLVTEADADRQFDYGVVGAGAPYVLSQLSGAYQSIPDFLDSQHSIETKADAEAYLSRLEAFATALDQEIEQTRHDVALGVIPPDFIIDKALGQMTGLRDTPAAKASLVQSVARRAAEKNITGDYVGRATAIYEAKVVPALARQAELMTALRAKATHDAGVWRLPQGEAYYAASLTQWTTSNITPEEAHRTGLDLVASLSARMDTILKAQGFTKGSVGERLRGLYSDPRYRYPNTDEGKAKLIADLNVKVRTVQARLPGFFKTLPKSPVEIRRVPAYIEAGAPGGYYQNASLDGSRPGAYFINLRDTAEVPSWTLPTLTYHEAIPGHHLQLSLQQEADLPLIRKVLWFSAYGEGWALYAEQLAQEMGMYADDPLGEVGYLHDAAFRAVRLVVDSGMHARRWSREQAIRYYTDAIGDPEASATTEVERYCVWPGQACSYMVGKLTWLRLREWAKAQLGAKFDIREFHDAGLISGATPLTVLDDVIADYVKAKLA
ncbi:MAG: DUF885 family protein [Caulobacteraceae bacterium]|nr:DUF885 family protein [Caulobacteraceae bacterium]